MVVAQNKRVLLLTNFSCSARSDNTVLAVKRPRSPSCYAISTITRLWTQLKRVNNNKCTQKILTKNRNYFPVKHNLKLYSVKSYYEIALMHLLTIVIFTHSVKIQRFLLFFSWHWLTIVISIRKKTRSEPRWYQNGCFFVETKKYKSSKNYFVLQCYITNFA